MSDLIAAVEQCIDAIRAVCRDGVVNAESYTADGWPVGGCLTADACAVIADARRDAAALGIPWEETVALLPDEEYRP